ncbi:MAG TPA: hypothetical protein VIT89_02875 [Solirubrobacterales bacterium]
MTLLALPAGASAAAPANDNFLERQVLGPGFPDGEPIVAAGDNFEAMPEHGESIPSGSASSAAGHSVWFEWEATSDEWVTIGTCDSEFPTLVAVFTGTEIDDLTQVVSGNGSEGPDCPSGQRQYTFKPTSGTRYVIAVDGNAFFPPEAPPPVTEGAIALLIEETPVPPNDEFENATEVAGQVFEEPGGHRFFFANTRGYNWTASIEHGEPQELNSGASVWYSFTAPEDATYSFSQPCCQAASSLNRDLYSGDAVDELTPVALGEVGPEVDLTAGETVRIRISGPISAGFEETLVAGFDFNVMAELAPLDSPPASGGGGSSTDPPPLPLDTTAPETTISRAYLKRKPPVPTFRFKFHSSEPGSSFRCSLDRQPFAPCGAVKNLGGQLTKGRHRLRAYAIDPAGNVDPTPAVARFRFPRSAPRQGQGGAA